MVLAALLAMDNWTPERVRQVANLVYRGAARRLVDYTSTRIEQFLDGGSAGDYATALQLLLAKEQAALSSLVDETNGPLRPVAETETAWLAAQLHKDTASRVTRARTAA